MYSLQHEARNDLYRIGYFWLHFAANYGSPLMPTKK